MTHQLDHYGNMAQISDEERTERTAALQALIELRLPPMQAARSLVRFGGESSQDLVTLGRSDARRVLDRYASGDLSPDDCARWAEALEAREDVGFEKGHLDRLTGFLFEMANPEINGPVSVEFVARWRAALDDRETATSD
ncbi:hypothetical protein GCM10029978_041650 [Actinoallomurus acanthiterrae]